MFGTYRTILALLVVAMHLGGVPRIGSYAVFGFYCLSGYLMTLIMQTNYGYTTRGVTKYAINRALRIYPIYWVSVLISIGLIYQLGEQFTAQYHHAIYLPTDLYAVVRNLFLFFPFMESPRLTPPAWALTVEVFFYILIGLGISKGKRTTVLWFLLSVAYHVAAIPLKLDTYFNVFAASLPFSTGALIFHYRQTMADGFAKAVGRLQNALPVIILGLVFTNWLVGYQVKVASQVFFYVNFLLCAAMVLTLSDRRQLPLISRKLDKWLGDFSYPIYLVHYQAGLVVLLGLSVIGIELKRPDLTLMFLSIPAILVISWIITVSLERPIELVRARIKG